MAPIQAILEGDVGLVGELVQACRAEGAGATLKVILETGRLAEPDPIAAAARAAVMAGADFLETSTGKHATGATLEAAAVLLAVIEEAEGRVGLKVAAAFARPNRRRSTSTWSTISWAGVGPRPRPCASAPRSCSTTCSGC